MTMQPAASLANDLESFFFFLHPGHGTTVTVVLYVLVLAGTRAVCVVFWGPLGVTWWTTVMEETVLLLAWNGHLLLVLFNDEQPVQNGGWNTTKGTASLYNSKSLVWRLMHGLNAEPEKTTSKTVRRLNEPEGKALNIELFKVTVHILSLWYK